MAQIWIRNGYLVTMNGQREVYPQGDVLVEGDRILAAGHVDPSTVAADAEIVDASGKMILPGFVNTHVHLSQQLARGLADDTDLLTWLRERIWPYESGMTVEDSYVSSLACCIELIRSGVTTFAEAGGQKVDGMARAVTEAGLRAILSRSTMDAGEQLPASWNESTDRLLERQIELIERYDGAADGRIGVWFCLRTIFNASDDLIVRTKELADRYNAGIHMHVAEVEEENRYAIEKRGASTVEHLARLGVLGERFLAVHCVWLSERELGLFREHNVKVSHNPAAAMKVVLGFAKIPEMVDMGIKVSIGTDGAPSNNRMDMLSEMFLVSLIHKGRTLNPMTMPAEKVLEMATVDGAECLGMEREIGSIEAGKKADIILIDPSGIGTIPLHDPIANLVYATQSANVDSTMCNGKWLMRGRQLVGIDEERVKEEAARRAASLIRRSGIVLPSRFPVITR